MEGHLIKSNRSKKNKVTDRVWHLFIFIITFGSFIEALFGFFLPNSLGNNLQFRVCCMGITIIGVFYEVINRLLSNYFLNNNLLEQIDKGLIISKVDRVESGVLLEIESDLDDAFGTKSGNYYIIIVTACLDPNEEPYINAIWKNINNGVKYLYITPRTDQEFINDLINIFVKKGYGDDINNIYKKVVMNIAHKSLPEIFTYLPEYYDLCLYCKVLNNSVLHDNVKGFACYQSELIKSYDREIAFYYRMTQREIHKVLDLFEKEFESERILQPYVSIKVEIKNSPIDGKGLFCKSDNFIKKGEVLLIKGGYELHRKDMTANKVIDSYLPIGDDLFLAAKTAEEEEMVKIYINHSCDPNVGMLDERTFVAIKDIKPGEELTLDYAFVDNEEYTFNCNCGSPNCRGKITGFDWKRPEIQKNYHKYFSPYLKRKILKKKARH